MTSILGIDTSQSTCSVCILSNGEVIYEFLHEEPNKQVEILPHLIQTALDATQLALESLDAIAPTVGPGSFTGVRIGLTLAKGIAVANGTKIIGTSTLDAIAFEAANAHPQTENIISLIDAKRGQFFTNHYIWKNQQLTAGEASLLPTDELAKYIEEHQADRVVCNAAGEISHLKNADQTAYLPSATASAKRAHHLIEQNQQGHTNPIYIRPPDAAIPQHKGI